LEDLRMPLCFREVLPPGVKTVPAQQEPVNKRLALQPRAHFLRELSDVLGILEDGKDFLVLVRVHAVQALEHLEAFECDGPAGRESIRKDGAPQRMGMQHRARPTCAYD